MTTYQPAGETGLQWPQASPGRGHALRARPSPALPPDSTPAAPGPALLRGCPGASTPVGKRSVACLQDRPRAAPPAASARLASAFRAAALLALALLAAPAYAQDTTAPSVSSITVGTGGDLNINYNEELDDASVPATTQFTVSYADVSVSVSRVQIQDTTVMGVTTSRVRLFITGGVIPAPGETLKLSYAVPAANPLQDTSGNDAPAFSDQGLTTAPSWSARTLDSAEAVRNSIVKLTFSGRLSGGEPARARFTVTAGGTGQTPSRLNYHLGLGSPAKGTVWLVLDSPIIKGDTVTVSYSPTFSSTQTGKRLRDDSNNALQAFSGSTVTNNAAELIQSAVVVGDQLTLTYSGALNTTALPDRNQFSVRHGENFDSVRGVTGVSRERVGRDADAADSVLLRAGRASVLRRPANESPQGRGRQDHRRPQPLPRHEQHPGRGRAGRGQRDLAGADLPGAAVHDDGRHGVHGQLAEHRRLRRERGRVRPRRHRGRRGRLDGDPDAGRRRGRRDRRGHGRATPSP